MKKIINKLRLWWKWYDEGFFYLSNKVIFFTRLSIRLLHPVTFGLIVALIIGFFLFWFIDSSLFRLFILLLEVFGLGYVASSYIKIRRLQRIINRTGVMLDEARAMKCETLEDIEESFKKIAELEGRNDITEEMLYL